MKNKFLKHIILIAFIVILFTGCKKILHHYKDEYVYMSDEMKSYIMQPVGSWWVYQDSVSGAIDTVKLISQENDYYYSPDEDYLLFEYLRNNFYSTINGEYSLYTKLNDFTCIDTLPYLIEYGRGAGIAFQDYANEFIGCFEYYKFHQNYNLNNTSYYKIKQFNSIFWMINVGIIQNYTIEQIFDENNDIIDTIPINWQLINYFINNE